MLFAFWTSGEMADISDPTFLEVERKLSAPRIAKLTDHARISPTYTRITLIQLIYEVEERSNGASRVPVAPNEMPPPEELTLLRFPRYNCQAIRFQNPYISL